MSASRFAWPKKRTTKVCWHSRKSRPWRAISLRIDRDPDFFALLRLRGVSKVFVAVRGREVVGCISAAFRTAYLSGIPELVAYIGDMKIHPRFSGSRISIRLLIALRADLHQSGVDVCFCVAADGNQRVLPMFEGRLGLPRWHSVGRFLVDGLLPNPYHSRSKHYVLEAAQRTDVSAISLMLDRFHKSRQFAPQLQEDEIAAALFPNPEVPFSKTFVARFEQRIVATITLCDIGPLKRNVFLNAPGALKAALALLRLAAMPFRGFRIPRRGEALRLLNVRHLACEQGHEASLPLLVSLARAEAFRDRFTFLMLGLHERDPLRNLVRRIPRLTFSSLAFSTSLGGPARLEELCRGIPFEDYALV